LKEPGDVAKAKPNLIPSNWKGTTGKQNKTTRYGGGNFTQVDQSMTFRTRL